MKDWKKRIPYLFSNEEKTLNRSAVGQLNWVAEISRPDISFSVCEASTKFKQATVGDVQQNNICRQNNKKRKELQKRN